LHELEVLGQRVVPGARVFDLGAHQGVVGLMLAHRVGPAGEVVLVEPNPHNFQMCGRNAGLNNMSWVKCVQAAVGNQEGTLSFNCGLNGQAGELSDYGGLIEVPCLTIDRLTDRFGRPDVVFIDVEGFECRALAGATRTFAMNPSWFVEVHIGAGLEAAGGSVDEVLRHFPAERFERYVHTERDGPLGDRPIALESVDPSILAKERFFLTALAR
jgi:FkbM family methyltransferase